MIEVKALLLYWLRNAFRAGVDFISIIIHPLAKLLGRNKVRILCYHRVCDLPETKDIMCSLNVPPAAFAKQMAFLSQNGFNIITLEQLIGYKEKNTKPSPKTIILTFDDGYRDNFLNALPVLEKYGFKGTFFVVTDYIDSDRIFQWLKLDEKSLVHSQQNRQYWLPLSRKEILEMSAHGACFGSHTKSHCYLSEVDQNGAMEELQGSKEGLEEILAKPVRCFSYPYGDMNEMVKDWVQIAGYRAAVTKAGSNTLKSDFLELRRISISSQDSLAKFIRMVEGAYDWWFRWLPLVDLAQRIILRGQKGE